MKNNLEICINLIKKWWKLVLIIVLIFMLMSTVLTFFLLKPKYEAETKIFIGKQKFKNTGQASEYNDEEVQLYQRLIKTYVEVIKTKNIAKAAIKEGNLHIEPNELIENLQTNPVTDTQILQLKYTGDTPQESYDALYSVTKIFIEVFRVLYPKGNVQVIEQVTTSGVATSPNNIVNIGIGAILGLIIGIVIAFIMEYTNHTFVSKEQIEKELEIVVLGVIPITEE